MVRIKKLKGNKNTYDFSFVRDDNDESRRVCVEYTFQVRLLHTPPIVGGQLVETVYVTAPHLPNCVVDVLVFSAVEIN